MSDLARDLIAENLRTKDPYLDLGRCGLTFDNFPVEIALLTHLKTLVLSNELNFYEPEEQTWDVNLSRNRGHNNRISDIPRILTSLQQLKALWYGDRYGGNQVKNLANLTSFVNLEELGLHNTGLIDFNLLTELKKIRVLDLSYTHITDLSPLAGLSQLNSLKLSGTQIVDLSPLAGLTQLNSLFLGSTQITDLSPLAGFSQLNSLDLINTQIADFSPLASLSQLKALNLPGTQIEDLSPLASLSLLNSLTLNQTQVADLSPLASLSQLKALYLSETQIEELLPLTGLSQLKSLDLSYTQITDLSPLAGLTQLNSLDLSDTQITDLSPLAGLSQLKALNLPDTQIADLSPLAGLSQLNSLYLSYTQITDLSPLEGLSQLKSLSLGSTQVEDLSPLANLFQLNWLYLNNTQVKDLTSFEGLEYLRSLNISCSNVTKIAPWLLQLSNLEELNLEGCLIRHLPYEIINQYNCYKDLSYWFADLQDGSVVNEEIKVIFLGNGRVGKSCILDRLTGLDYQENRSSTHAIQLVPYPTEITLDDGKPVPLTLNYWDFGGQDIYHGTHRIFMRSRALFVLIWDWPGERDRHRMSEEVEADGYLHRNHILPHWLDYIKSLSKESPVIVVQNKIDAHKTKPVPNQEQIEKIYQVEYFHHVSAKTGRGISDLKEIIVEVIKEMPEWQLEMPASWHTLRLAIREKAKVETDISMEEFNALCEESGVRKVSRPSLLRYLHDTGVVFFKENLFHGRIILDQQWVIKAVYSLFDRQYLFWDILKQGNGQFTFEQLHKHWRDHEEFSKEKSQLALSYMLNAEICYELYSPEMKEKTNTIYIAPQLLPEQLAEQRQQLWPSEGVFLQYEYQYLHQVFIHRLIVRAGKLALPQNVWKNGIWFLWEGTYAIIQAQEDEAGPGGYIQVQINGSKEGELLRRIRTEFDYIHPKAITYTCLVSLDGESWADLETVASARKNQLEELLCLNEERVDPKHFGIFFDEAQEMGDQAKKGIQGLEPTRPAPLTIDLINKWREQVANDEMESVIQHMLPYSFLHDLAIQNSRRYRDLQHQIHSGILSEAERHQLKNKLTLAVLYTIDVFEAQIQ